MTTNDGRDPEADRSGTTSRRDVLRVSGAAAAAIVSGMAWPTGRAYPAESKNKILGWMRTQHLEAG